MVFALRRAIAWLGLTAVLCTACNHQQATTAVATTSQTVSPGSCNVGAPTCTLTMTQGESSYEMGYTLGQADAYVTGSILKSGNEAFARKDYRDALDDAKAAATLASMFFGGTSEPAPVAKAQAELLEARVYRAMGDGVNAGFASASAAQDAQSIIEDSRSTPKNRSDAEAVLNAARAVGAPP